MKKGDYTSFEIQTLDGDRLYLAEKRFDFPKMFDSDGNLMENVLMIKGKNLPEISRGSYVYVIAAKKNGDRVRYKTAVSVSSCFQMNLQLRPDKEEVMQERRRYFKIKTSERGFITFVVHTDDTTTQMEPPAEVKIMDINVGGVFFVCANPEIVFTPGDKVMLVVALDKQRLDLMTEILRVQEIKNDDEAECGYGCSFIGATSAEEEIISRYVYKMQYEMLQKQRESRYDG